MYQTCESCRHATRITTIASAADGQPPEPAYYRCAAGHEPQSADEIEWWIANDGGDFCRDYRRGLPQRERRPDIGIPAELPVPAVRPDVVLVP